MEGYSNAGPLSPAPVGGRRHMKKVSAKTIRRTLRKLGMKPKGRVVLKGGEGEAAAATPAAPAAPAAPAGGARRKTRRSASHKGGRRHRSRSLFGLKY